MSWREARRSASSPAVRFGSAGDVGAVSLDDERELHCADESADVLPQRARSRAASSCTQANSTSLTRRWRSKLSRLYSKSHRSTGISTRRLTNRSATRRPPPMRLVAHGRARAASVSDRRAARAAAGRTSGRVGAAVQERFDFGEERRIFERAAIRRSAGAAGAAARGRAPAAPSSPASAETSPSPDLPAAHASAPGRWRSRPPRPCLLLQAKQHA